MSGNFDSENISEPSSAVIDNEDGDVGVNSESTTNKDSSSTEANYDSNNNNEDGIIVNTDNNGSGGDSDGVVVSEDAGREDMFLDASEDLGADGRDSSATFTEAQGSTDREDDERHTRFRGLDNEMQNDYMVDEMERLRATLDKTINEKESIIREHKDEMEMAAKGIANLRDQMRDLVNKQLLLDGNNSGAGDCFPRYVEQTPLHEIIHECSMFFRHVMDEMGDLNAKSTEVSVSREVVDSYLSSAQNESTEIQLRKDQYMEEVTNRMLGSFASLVYVGDLSDNSVIGKIAHVEKSVYALIENYNWFLYQSDQMRQCLTEVRPDLVGQNDYGVIFAAANDELLGFKKKEADLSEKLSLLEDEKREMTEQLDKHKATIDTANAELERLRAELEQEKHRYSNTKEKLSLAVTKGKALVQQRDLLKQTLADRTTELEKCLVTLKENSGALEAAELTKEELVKSQILGASLQEILAEKDLILEKLDDIVFQSDIPEDLKSKDVTERIRWLVDEQNALKDISLKFHQLANVLWSINLPENFSFSDLESRLGWLAESFDQAKAEIGSLGDEISRTRESLCEAKVEIDALQDENVGIRETAYNEMDQITASLSIALVEKEYVKMELEDMSSKFEAVVQKEQQASSEKEQMLMILLEACGVQMVDEEPSETVLVEQCLAIIKERSSFIHESSIAKEEILQSLQILLFVKDQDLVLYENLLEEEMETKKTEVDNLCSDLRKASEEVASLKEEKTNLKRDLERTEEKSGLIREKLSMAVKKGKGLVQEREGLKKLIDEKNSEIEKLKLELQQKESTVNYYKDESSRLAAEVQTIVNLEEDLLSVKDQRDQLERDLLENSKLLSTMTESVNSIVLPVDSSFEGPDEKLRWFSGYFGECQAAKAHAEQQLEEATAEIEKLTTMVSEAYSSVKSLEDALTVAEEKISRVIEEKRELEVGRVSVQEQLQRAVEESRLLAQAEVNISRLVKEKEETESSRAASEAELDKARAEITNLIGKLSEATTSIKTLEDTVSYLENRIAGLSDENNEAQIGRSNVENELKKLKEETDTLDSKLHDAYSRIKSLEDALTKSDNGISELASEKKLVEQELSTLSAKLSVCMEELAGTHSSLESRSLELFDHLKDLEVLGEDESLLSCLRKCCDTKFESLKEMDRLFRNIRGQFAEMGSENHPVPEEPSGLTKLLSTTHDDILGADSFGSHTATVEADDISLYAQKIVESFHLRKTISVRKVDGFLSFLNECNASVVQELQSTINWIVEKMISMNQKMKNMATDYHILENTVTTLEDDVSVLLSACTEATQLLQLEVDKRMPEINSTPEHEAEKEPKLSKSKHMKTVEMLLSATAKVCSVCEQFEKSRNMLSSTIEELQLNLNDMKVMADKAIEERDQCNNKVYGLETDLALLQNLSHELKLKLQNYQHIEVNLRDKEAEISSLQSTLMTKEQALMTKEQEAGEALLWASHVKNLLERANGISIFIEDSHIRDREPQDRADMKKLLYIIDNFPELQHQIDALSHEKEELQIALEAQLRETENLKDRVVESSSHEQELAKIKSKIIEMEAGLERIIQKFAGRDITGDQKSIASNDLVEEVEKLVMIVISESENLKSKAHVLESEVGRHISNEQEIPELKGQLLYLEAGVQNIIRTLRGDITWDQESIATNDLVQVLEKLVMNVVSESQSLKSKAHELDSEVTKSTSSEQELAKVRGQLFDIEAGIQSIIQKLSGNATGEQKPVAASDLVQVLEKMVVAMIMESENSKSKVGELELKLLGSQKAVDELLLKVKALDDTLQSRVVPTETVQERRIFEAPSQSPASEISEVEDVASVSKPTISPVPSSAHVRTAWKGSSDHITVNIDSESSRLIDKEEAVEDKGHVFKSLGTSGLVPTQGKMIADRIDGIWVSSGRLLMSRPGARLGLIAYWLFMHIWLLGTIL